MFEQAGIMEFCRRLDAYDEEVTAEFSMTFDGAATSIFCLLIPIFEFSTSNATRLARHGE